MGVKHKKTLSKPDNGNSGQIQSNDWNDNHDLTGMLALLDALTSTANTVLTFDASGNPVLLPKNQILSGNSPAFTGTPTAPTAVPATNNDQIATTAFVRAAVTALIAGSPGLLDTLDEIAAALGDDPNFATTMTGLLALKAPLASPGFSGNPTVPDQAALTNNGRIANTKYVDAAAPAAVAAARAALTSLCTQVASPASTSNATGVMMGLGATTCRFTPTTSRVEFTFDGAFLNNSAGATGQISPRYGTGAGPANGAALTGTVVGNSPAFGNGGSTYQPGFSVTRSITGLTPGTTYWFDLGLNATAGASSLTGLTFTIRDF